MWIRQRGSKRVEAERTPPPTAHRLATREEANSTPSPSSSPPTRSNTSTSSTSSSNHQPPQQQPPPKQEQQRQQEHLQSDFFTRHALTQHDKLLCDDLAQSLFAHTHRPSPQPYAHQGWCSYSVLLHPRRRGTTASASGGRDGEGEDLLLQFRPPRHALPVRVMEMAGRVYGEGFVPRVVWAGAVVLWPRGAVARELMGEGEGGGRGGGGGGGGGRGRAGEERRAPVLEVAAMAVVPGVPYSVVQVRRRHLDDGELRWQERLVVGFAGFVARGWVGERGRGGDLAAGALQRRAGGKLAVLAERLPAEVGLRGCAGMARERWRRAAAAGLLPLTVNHGDVVPGNVLVDEATGALTGLVDWAEAEVGVWGLGLYGLEFLLGFVTSSSSSGQGGSLGEQGRDSTSPGVAWGAEGKGATEFGGKESFGFTYYAQAAELRALFWEEVGRRVGSAFGEPGVREAVDAVRDVGVLLWFGFAWDDGRIDRVVNASDDPREVMLLETFLGVRSDEGGNVEKARL